MNKLSEMLDSKTVEKLNKMGEEEVKTDKEIIETELDIPFSPMDGRVLVKPLEEIKTVKKVLIPDEEANIGKSPEDVQETKEIEEEVVSNLRVGVVLSYDGSTTFPFEVGDKVVFVYKAAMPFDLYKDTVLLRKYDILGLWVK